MALVTIRRSPSVQTPRKTVGTKQRRILQHPIVDVNFGAGFDVWREPYT